MMLVCSERIVLYFFISFHPLFFIKMEEVEYEGVGKENGNGRNLNKWIRLEKTEIKIKNGN